MKTVALKNPNNGEFTMMQLTGFGNISEDDRSQYTSHSTFTNYQTTASDTFGTKVSLGNIQSSVSLHDTRLDTLESSSGGGGGVINGGTSNIQITTTDINGGDATT